MGETFANQDSKNWRLTSGEAHYILPIDGYDGIDTNCFKGRSSYFLRPFTTLKLTYEGVDKKPFKIKSSAFEGCTKFKYIEGIDKIKITSIETKGFKGCSAAFSTLSLDNVTSIGTSAFQDCKSIKTILSLGNSITSIGASTFQDCNKLESINIPNSVEIIYASAFEGCTNLEITVPSSITSIKNYAFSNCKKVSISISKKNLINNSHTNLNLELLKDGSITEISQEIFENYTNLKSIILPDNITSIGASAFQGCTALVSVTLPDSITSISASAFKGCTNLKSINIPYSVTSIGENAFSGCTKMNKIYQKNLNKSITVDESAFPDGVYITETQADSEILDSPENVNSIDEGKFIGRLDLQSIEISKSSSIGKSAFEGCVNLQSVILFENVTSIAEDAFKDCINLKVVYIHNSSIDIDNSAFDNCPNVVFITPSAIDLITKSYYTTLGYDIKDANIYYKIANNDLYISGKGSLSNMTSIVTTEEIKNVHIEEGITSIGTSAFQGCTNLRSINLPNSIASIGELAFQGCSKLESINLPNNITTIYANAFQDCTNLKITTPNSDSIEIRNYAFNNCKKVSIPISKKSLINSNHTNLNLELLEDNSVTSIEASAFSGYTNLKSIILPDNITSIGASAFQGCSKLESINIPNSVEIIYASTFQGCTNLQSISLPENITEIRQSAFYECSNLVDINIPKKISVIGMDAFYGCLKLKPIFISQSLNITNNYEHITINVDNIYKVSSTTYTIIDIDKFSKINILKNNIEKIIIQNGVKTIPSNLFKSCTSLSEILIPNSVMSIGESAFEGCTSLVSATLPDSIASIGENAFKNCSSLASITIPKNVIFINKTIFENCSSLKKITFNNSSLCYVPLSSESTIVLGKNIKSINTNDFNDLDSKLKEIEIHNNNIKIENPNKFANFEGNAHIPYQIKKYFKNCKKIWINEGVTNIEENAFDDFSKLEELYLPSSVKNISSLAFDNCDKLKTIKIDSSNTIFKDVEGKLLYLINGDIVSIVYCTEFGDYSAIAENENNITIEDYAFKNADTTNSLSLPWDKIIEIGYKSFPFGKYYYEKSSNNYYYLIDNTNDEANVVEIPSSPQLALVAKGAYDLNSNTIDFKLSNNDKNEYSYYFSYGGDNDNNENNITINVEQDLAEHGFDSCFNYLQITTPITITLKSLKIPKYSFANCHNKLKIVLPNKSEELFIGKHAFINSNVQKVDFSNLNPTKITIDKFAFVGLPYSLLSQSQNHILGWKSCLFKEEQGHRYYYTKKGLQYTYFVEYSQTQKIKEEPILGKKGYHYCSNIFDVFNYYAGTLKENFNILKVAPIENSITKTSQINSECVTQQLQILNCIDTKELLGLLSFDLVEES